MNSQDSRRLLYWKGVPKTIRELVDLRRVIREFKAEEGIFILHRYYKDPIDIDKRQWEFEQYPRFIPKEPFESGMRNVGLFSTAVCLETIAAYKKEVESNLKRRKGKHLEQRKWIGKDIDNAQRFFEFIVRALNDEFLPDSAKPYSGTVPDLLVRITTLVRFGGYLSRWGMKEDFWKILREKNNKIYPIFEKVCKHKVIDKLNKQFDDQKEDIHPFLLYKFMQLVSIWGEEFEKMGVPLRKNLGEEVYLLAKYELYRQMALKLSGDMALYDAKRLIYSLLIVYFENKFSNNLVRDQALELIFEPQNQNPNAIWPTGQLLPISIDGQTSILGIECAYDLLECKHIRSALSNFLPALKVIYDCNVRTLRVERKKEGGELKMELTGWYPLDQRDKTPASWVTAFSLGFIKSFCKFLSFKINQMSKEHFRMNYREVDTKWDELYDSSAVKSKLRLMLTDDSKRKKRTAILFGPPGTGKTTYARALADKKDWEFLELTPGDFFSVDVSAIPGKINETFKHLLHLEKTVVFIDEIDDLVRSREMDKETSGFDPRIIYVNTLLPRFQEVHDKGEIILIMATNSIELVDEAIKRPGRIDLIIPVGAVSPHGRLKLFRSFMEKLPQDENDKIKVLKQYLADTECRSFNDLRLYLDALHKITNFTAGKVAKVKQEMGSIDDKLSKFIQWETSYTTRPNVDQVKDFCDFSGLKTDDEKTNLIKLFLALHSKHTDAEKVKELVTYFCEPDREYYNIITPFYDDIKQKLGEVPDKLEKLIFERSMK